MRLEIGLVIILLKVPSVMQGRKERLKGLKLKVSAPPRYPLSLGLPARGVTHVNVLPAAENPYF